MNILGIIPARYASSRFPGKPLAEIAGKSMIERVYQQSKKSKCIQKVLVATDDERIYNHIVSFGGNVIMTNADHPSGTDRCFEAYQNLDEHFDFVINIQGDEPFISPDQVDLLASVLQPEVELATLVKKIDSHEEIIDPNEAKVVINKSDEAIYFSRSPIPFLNQSNPDWTQSGDYYKHVGIYAYRTDILKEITRLDVSTLEVTESLEQLRWIQNGYKIKIAVTNSESMCIDTPEDIEEAIVRYNL